MRGARRNINGLTLLQTDRVEHQQTQDRRVSREGLCGLESVVHDGMGLTPLDLLAGRLKRGTKRGG